MTRKAKTPIRAALSENSALTAKVRNGLGAIADAHKVHIEESIRTQFADSLDLDAALLESHPQENRWDYLLGHKGSASIVALEPHSAKQDQISTIISKRAMAQQQLQQHFVDGKRVARWLWVASGKVQFADTERARRILDQNGIEFLGSRLLAKHLPRVPASERVSVCKAKCRN